MKCKNCFYKSEYEKRTSDFSAKIKKDCEEAKTTFMAACEENLHKALRAVLVDFVLLGVSNLAVTKTNTLNPSFEFGDYLKAIELIMRLSATEKPSE